MKAFDGNGNQDGVYAVKLMNEQGSELGIYDPEHMLESFPGKEHQLADNEDLIGVYGVMGKSDWLSAFGFIVRVKNDN